ncbi:MAG TPA: AAA family ATPase [Mycobacteriales bacterium]|nr:AAA family ATPase [Mycobacteriales bacterium]
MIRATDGNPVREVLERLPRYRAWTGYSQFNCPVCGRAALVYFDEPETTFHCPGGCTKLEILAAAHEYRRPAERLSGVRPEHPLPHVAARRASWPSAEYELARLRARAEAEAQFAEEQASPDDAWTPSLLAGGVLVAEPTILKVGIGPYLLRRGQVSLVSGLPGSAKTPLAYLGVVDAVRQGQSAILIDHEMAPAAAVALLRELGLSNAEIDMQVIHYADPPPLTVKTQERVVATLDGREVSYVVIDALAGSMPAGTSQNDAADVNAWFAAMPKWFARQFGAAVLVIDHSNKEDGPAPGGSVRKQGVPDFRMWLRLDEGFSRQHENGRSTLIVQRDRTGTYGRGETVAELVNELRGDRSVFVLRPPGGGSATSDGVVDLDLGAMPAGHALRLEVLDGLRRAGRHGLLTQDIAGASGGAEYQQRKQALDWLVKDGQVVSEREPGTSRGRRFRAAEFASGAAAD